MNGKKVFLLLNGSKPKKVPNLKKYQLICATDGAYQFLKEQHITPDFISGDFDSITSIPDTIEVIHTPDQNFTDFDKILQLLHKKGYTDIDVYGASGKEQDHFLGNLHTAIQWQNKMKLTFYDDFCYYFLATSTTTLHHCKGNTISLIPFPKAENISCKGLQYPLSQTSLTFGTQIGTRNKAIENTVEISFTKGDLFIFVHY